MQPDHFCYRKKIRCTVMPYFEESTRVFITQFISGVGINFYIAGIALLLGVIAGCILILAQLIGSVVSRLSNLIISLFRAAPTFVVMFFSAQCNTT